VLLQPPRKAYENIGQEYVKGVKICEADQVEYLTVFSAGLQS
jgi:hypothetical protein